ncbi:MAG: ATP-binding protein [Acidobacteriota bacterium]
MDKDDKPGTSDARADRLERSRQAFEQRYNELFEQAALGIVVSTPAGVMLACNPGFARMLGFASVDQAVGTRMQELYETAADRDRFVAELREKTRLESHHVRLRRRDGRPLEALTNVVGSYDSGGELVELRGYLIDVTASVEAESALLVREQLFRAVFVGASDAMLLLDDRRAIVDANPAASELFARPLAELTTQVLDQLFADEDGSVAAAWRELIAGGEATREHRVPGSAAPRLVECSYRARVHPGRHLCIARDITDRRLLEERLAQAARIDSVGRLAAGIAHDFNNLLTAILGYTELLLAQRRPDDPERVDLEQIYQAGRRASTLTQQLLAFGRQQVLQPREVNLSLVIGGLKPMLRSALRQDITLAVKLGRVPMLVTIDPHQIEQAVLNLVLNARDALPSGGIIRVDLRQVTLSPEEMPNDRRAGAGTYVRLRVIDNGTGLTPEVRQHLFEPFFTTKDIGKGTGLGLASVYGIVHQSGGFIVVDSPASGGTVFALYFPATGETRTA